MGSGQLRLICLGRTISLGVDIPKCMSQRIGSCTKTQGILPASVLSAINEEEAVIIRRIFDLYANQGLGVRTISKILYDEGYTSRQGNTFNVLTIRHILCNPKYKGWYCANMSQTVDYRTKRKVFLDESEWIMYPDPSIPAIVSEELWDRAHALYKKRSAECQARANGASYHNRYPYSGKIICEEHGTSFHRQVRKSSLGEKEVWQCRVYRNRGRAACSAPQLRTTELDQVMAQIFDQLAQNKQTIIDAVVGIIQSVPADHDYERDILRIEEEMSGLQAKKDRLLEMSIAGAITVEEFKSRNDGFNEQLQKQQEQIVFLQEEAQKSAISTQQLGKMKAALERELSFESGVNSELVTTILDHIVVKKGSTKEEVHLDIYLKFGDPYGVVFQRGKSSFCINRSTRVSSLSRNSCSLWAFSCSSAIPAMSAAPPSPIMASLLETSPSWSKSNSFPKMLMVDTSYR